MRKFVESIRRWRMKEKDFQREIDIHRLFLLLAHRAEAIKGRNSVIAGDSIMNMDVDGLLERAENLSTDQKEKECKAMVDVQVKTYFKLLKVKIICVFFVGGKPGPNGSCQGFPTDTISSENPGPLGFATFLNASRIPGAGLGVFIKV
jgi:hypothetical protein